MGFLNQTISFIILFGSSKLHYYTAINTKEKVLIRLFEQVQLHSQIVLFKIIEDQLNL